MVRYQCEKMHLSAEEERDICQIFCLKYLQGTFKYDPDHVTKGHKHTTSLSTFIYQMIHYTLLNYIHDNKLEREQDCMPQQYFEINEYCHNSLEEMEAEIVQKELDGLIASSLHQSTQQKKLSCDIYHQIFRLKMQEYYNREIADHYEVSDMRVSQILSPIREVASRFL
jgi:RNA polymerase sigma factor (sigma-70 family)